MNSTNSKSRLMRTKEASEYVRISQWKIRQLVADGKLPVVRFEDAGYLLFDRKDLDGLIDRSKSIAQQL